MPFARPTLLTLRERIAAEFATRLKDKNGDPIGPVLARSNLYALSQMMAGASHEHHGHLAWAAEQILPDTADADHLVRWASIYNLNRKASTKASGELTFTGSGTSAIPQGTLLQRADGVQFTTTAAAALVGGTASNVPVEAVTAEEKGNTDVGIKLTLVSALDGINSKATVEDDGSGGGLTGGTDPETDDALRTRLLERIQDPPHGGAETDYIAWAKETAGVDVTRVFVFPTQLGAGTVQVFFTVDNDSGGPIPSGSQVTSVQTYIDTKRPVTATVTVTAPTAVELNPSIQLVNPAGDTTVQAAIQTALQDLLFREAKVGGTLLISHIREAISTAAGEIDTVVISPTADVTVPMGSLSVLSDGTITWS